MERVSKDLQLKNSKNYRVTFTQTNANFPSPIDSEGHGTHTYSTVAGHILATFDDAIADGANIISVYLGSDWPLPYMEDPITIGSFHAMKNGILTSNSAGNSVPYPYSLSNHAPWTLTLLLTVEFSLILLLIPTTWFIGRIMKGLSINNFDLDGTIYQLIWGGDACILEALNSYKVEQKTVICDALVTGSGVVIANGVGAIMADSFYSKDFAFSFPLLETVIRDEDKSQKS
ncbi:hypothetical protein Peur_040465 [Populus x canadensis]